MRLKSKDELKVVRESHHKRYGESNVIGKLRAHGRFRIRYAERDDQPVFMGWCQAAGTADMFRICIWKNADDYRFEIIEQTPYKQAQISSLPF